MGSHRRRDSVRAASFCRLMEVKIYPCGLRTWGKPRATSLYLSTSRVKTKYWIIAHSAQYLSVPERVQYAAFVAFGMVLAATAQLDDAG